MPSLAQKFPDDPPTKPIENLPSREMIRWARVEAISERIATHLLTEGEPNLAEVHADLAQIRAIAGSALR